MKQVHYELVNSSMLSGKKEHSRENFENPNFDMQYYTNIKQRMSMKSLKRRNSPESSFFGDEMANTSNISKRDVKR